MNQGIHCYSVHRNLITTTQFDESGSYFIQPGTNHLRIIAIGGGGGGGGGRRQASGVATAGGGGGGGASILVQDYSLKELGLAVGSTLLITIGAGGAGGAGGPSDTSDGSNGGLGSLTQVTIQGKPGILMNALGGDAGAGAVDNAPSGGAVVNRIIQGLIYSSGAGSQGNFSGQTDVTVASPYDTGGAGGSGVDITNSADFGSGIALQTSAVVVLSNPDIISVFNYISGSLANAATTADGGFNIPPHLPNGNRGWGVGGAGGGGGASAGASNGGAGWRGSGGGGGGGSRNGFTAGNGGNGGNGYVCIVAMR